MDLAQAQGIMRQLHGQYATEKAAIAYLDEVLTAVTTSQDAIHTIQQSTTEAETARDAMQVQVDAIATVYQEKTAALEQAYVQRHEQLQAQSEREREQCIRQQKSEELVLTQMTQEEQAVREHLDILRANVRDAQAMKADLDGQISDLQAQIRSIRNAMAGVPA